MSSYTTAFTIKYPKTNPLTRLSCKPLSYKYNGTQECQKDDPSRIDHKYEVSMFLDESSFKGYYALDVESDFDGSCFVLTDRNHKQHHIYEHDKNLELIRTLGNYW